MKRLCFLAVFIALTCLQVRAEVPPLSAEKLKDEAAFIVTGKITEIKSSDPKELTSGTETTYEITVEISKVIKGKLDDVKTITIRGHSHMLKRGFVGSSGHRDNKTGENIKSLGKGYEITVYLKEPKEKVYDILFPNGFEVLSKPKK